MNQDAAYEYIQAVDGAAWMLAQATALEMQLADERALVKDAGIHRLMDQGIERSVTAAEKFIEKDAEFLAHRVREREAVAARIVAEGKYQAALSRARLAVELSVLEGSAR